ncbi:MAG: glc operon protein GlcG, partial [Alphaproteobacteria bacterium]
MSFASTQRLTTSGAKLMLAAAIAKAEEISIPVTVAIVDSGGHMLVLERMDGGRFHTVHSSTTKAVTAASNKRPTTTKGAQGQELDTL